MALHERDAAVPRERHAQHSSAWRQQRATPADWDEEDDGTQLPLASVLHAPRLATRGLLMSLQMLLTLTTSESLVHSWGT